jgi:hypothetical protein
MLLTEDASFDLTPDHRIIFNDDTRRCKRHSLQQGIPTLSNIKRSKGCRLLGERINHSNPAQASRLSLRPLFLFAATT